MTLADWQPLFQSVIEGIAAIVGMVITGLIAVYVPRAVLAFETATGIAFSTQQRAAVLGAAQTQAGIIETALQQGALRLSDVKPNSPIMLDQAQQALARVPDAAAAVGTTTAAMASIIVGRADTAKALAVPVRAP